jgi:G:T-mismatch repair DNA endonuclease (very short patch repair protein)
MKQEKYRKMSKDIMRANWENGVLDKKVISEQMKQTQRSGKIKSTITSKKEKEIIKELKNMGYDSIHSYRIDSKICDIYVPSLNLIIEYFGDYWHCNPKKYDSNYFNMKKNKFAWELWEYDKKKVELIKSYDYNLEIVWESDFNEKTTLQKIIKKYDKKN